MHTRSTQRPSLFVSIVNEKTYDHCLDIIAAMANQQLAKGARFGTYPGDYFAILDQLEIQKLIFHIHLLFAWVVQRWTHFAMDYRSSAFEDVLPNRREPQPSRQDGAVEELLFQSSCRGEEWDATVAFFPNPAAEGSRLLN